MKKGAKMSVYKTNNKFYRKMGENIHLRTCKGPETLGWISKKLNRGCLWRGNWAARVGGRLSLCIPLYLWNSLPWAYPLATFPAKKQ